MKSKLALATVLLSLASSGFAASQQQDTVKCPDISELKASKFTEASAVYDTNLWEVMQTSSQYGTQNNWNFKLNIEAEDKAGALQEAANNLSQIHLIDGPERVDNKFMCHYRSGQFEAVAIMSLPTTKTVAQKAKAAKVVSKAEKLAAK